ncbi:hypothetical protein [Streptomyces iconiensis]|uniref:Lipoprotein n=1 Tax=Streptomyces iconiensis TaxID=1384038 RepID=A0ABT7A0H3_9ACTN|nr:hypothetical protein [Streptomyces iconiensis]MDJ1134336.1 hypothetical protein [Streptomyces iconiensis]
MVITRKPTLLRGLPVAAMLLSGVLLTGCGGDSSAEPSAKESSGGASSGGGERAGGGAGKGFDKALEYAECMRDNGVTDFPDPKQDGGGVRMEVDKAARDSPHFKKAEQACRDKAPQMGGGGGGKPLDAAKVAAWAQCMRENGLTDFPDPEINGSAMSLDLRESGISPKSKPFQDAQKACKDKYPGGGLMMKGGGPQ